MSLRDRVPVEPLAEVRLDRLEQRVVAAAAPLLARPRRAPWTPWLVAAAAAVATAAVVVAVGVDRHRPPVAASAPVSVATDAHGTRVDLGDALVDVGPDTRFEVVRTDGGIALELAAGDVALEVPPRAGRPPLWVHAGDVGVRVVGTGFRVHRGDRVDVEVTHGVVEVHRAGERARVAGGQRWSSSDGAVVAVAAASPTGPAAARTATGATTATTDDGTIAAGPLSLGPAAGAVGLAERRAPALTVPPAPPRPTRPAPGERTVRGPSAAATPPAPPAPPVLDLRAELVAVAVPGPPGAAAGTDAATRAAAYQRTAATARGADAAAALWALAHTQAMALGKDGEALRSLDAYVRRFPSGAETESVLWLRLRLLCRRNLDEPCRVAAHAYLGRFPGGTRGALAARVTQSR